MHSHHRSTLAAAALVFLMTGPAHAQAGRADLRFVAPLPQSVLFTTTDSMTNTVSGLPTGDMTTTGTMRSVSQLQFMPSDSGLTVIATLKELEGVTKTPMGDMPISMAEGEPIEIHITATGPDPEQVAGDVPAAGMGASMEDVLGPARAVAGLLILPGRELRMGETWVDTMRATPEIHEGLTIDITVVSRGTYQSDSMLGDRHVNVLRISTETTTKMSGPVQGMEMNQDMTSAAEETVLWDSARHIPLHRDGVTTMTMDSHMVQYGMTITMTTRSRSITAADPGDGDN